MRVLLLCALTLTSAAPASGQGQTLEVRGVRSLAFGVVLPGVPRFVPRTDPANSGEFSIRGPQFSLLLLRLTLPSSLTGPGAAAMPVSFGSNDAGFSVTGAPGTQFGFNPNVGGLGLLLQSGEGFVFLGGTANPIVGQAAGSYVGTVVLTVTVL